MLIRSQPPLILVFLTTLFLAAPAGAQSMRLTGLDDNVFGGNRLWDVNPVTGQSLHGRGTGVEALAGLAWGPDGCLYALTSFSSTPPNALVGLDPQTGTVSVIGDTGLPTISEGDLAFDPLTGVLYGVQDGFLSLQMFTLSLADGSATVVGPVGTGTSDISGLAFDKTGRLFALDTFQAVLLELDPATGATLSAVPVSQPLGLTAGMDFDPYTGELYVADGSSGTLYVLDKNSGLLTAVGPAGSAGSLGAISFQRKDIIALNAPPAATVGQPVTFSWENCPPVAPIWLYASKNTAGSLINGQPFDIGPLRITLFRSHSSASGAGSWTTPPVPQKAAGRTVSVEMRADLLSYSFDSNAVQVSVN